MQLKTAFFKNAGNCGALLSYMKTVNSTRKQHASGTQQNRLERKARRLQIIAYYTCNKRNFTKVQSRLLDEFCGPSFFCFFFQERQTSECLFEKCGAFILFLLQFFVAFVFFSAKTKNIVQNQAPPFVKMALIAFKRLFFKKNKAKPVKKIK